MPPLPESVARFARAVNSRLYFRSLGLPPGRPLWWLGLWMSTSLPRGPRSTTNYQLLKVKHTSMKRGSIEYLKEKDPGSMPSSLICADCNAPWGNLPKCLCKGTTTIDLSSTPMSVIEVDGQVWQLRFPNSGPAWVLSDSKGIKEAGYIEVGYLNKTPLRQQPLALTRRWSASQNRCLNQSAVIFHTPRPSRWSSSKQTCSRLKPRSSMLRVRRRNASD